MRLSLLIIIGSILLCSSGFQKEKTIIAVAANAQYALREIQNKFEIETGEKIELIIGSSGKLCAQIREGAPFDVFISADNEYPQVLYDEGLAWELPKIYGYGSLVLWTLSTDYDLTIHSLISSDIKKIAIANPNTSPYGEAAISALKFNQLYEKVKPNLIYGENIAQTNQYVINRNVELAITAKATVLSAELKTKGKWIEVKKNNYTPIGQSAIFLKNSREKKNLTAEKFFHFLYAEHSKKIFEKYGYQLNQ